MGITRAQAAVDKAASLERPLIFAVGNAPTALLRINDLILEGKLEPKLIIGVPVGFVNVESAKELFLESPVPCIIARGRKGGSAVAAAIVNALLYAPGSP
jgi:precorrin-8X/cobalt-precorrin-8 methylmutase